ncbi:MAG TPA: aromatic amino acid ammonia-lyase, partial [Bacteroidota bacterium]
MIELKRPLKNLMAPFLLDGNSLSVERLSDIVYQPASIGLSPRARKSMTASRALVEDWLRAGETIYGVTTGFGEFSTVRISAADILRLQENLILSHSAGAGDPLPPEIVRAMMVLRVNALAKGYSGISLPTVDLLVKMVNKNITPVIPSQGSVGASGDLVQLAHLVLAMMGKGFVLERTSSKKNKGQGGRGAEGRRIAASVALKKYKLKPIRLSAKEGIALINGTQMMTAYAALAVHHARQLCKIVDIAGALSVEALR